MCGRVIGYEGMGVATSVVAISRSDGCLGG